MNWYENKDAKVFIVVQLSDSLIHSEEDLSDRICKNTAALMSRLVIAILMLIMIYAIAQKPSYAEKIQLNSTTFACHQWDRDDSLPYPYVLTFEAIVLQQLQ